MATITENNKPKTSEELTNILLKYRNSYKETQPDKNLSDKFSAEVDAVTNKIAGMDNEALKKFFLSDEGKKFFYNDNYFSPEHSGKFYDLVVKGISLQPTTSTTSIDTSAVTDIGNDVGAGIKTGADAIKEFSKKAFTAMGLDENKVGNFGHIATGIAAFMALGGVTNLAGSLKKLGSGDLFGAAGGVFGVVKSAFVLGVGVLIANCFWGKDGHHLSQNQSKNTEPAHTV